MTEELPYPEERATREAVHIHRTARAIAGFTNLATERSDRHIQPEHYETASDDIDGRYEMDTAAAEGLIESSVIRDNLLEQAGPDAAAVYEEKSSMHIAEISSRYSARLNEAQNDAPRLFLVVLAEKAAGGFTEEYDDSDPAQRRLKNSIAVSLFKNEIPVELMPEEARFAALSEVSDIVCNEFAGIFVAICDELIAKMKSDSDVSRAFKGRTDIRDQLLGNTMQGVKLEGLFVRHMITRSLMTSVGMTGLPN